MPLNELNYTEDMTPAERALLLQHGAYGLRGLQLGAAAGAQGVNAALGRRPDYSRYQVTKDDRGDLPVRGLDLLMQYAGLFGTPLVGASRSLVGMNPAVARDAVASGFKNVGQAMQKPATMSAPTPELPVSALQQSQRPYTRTEFRRGAREGGFSGVETSRSKAAQRLSDIADWNAENVR